MTVVVATGLLNIQRFIYAGEVCHKNRIGSNCSVTQGTATVAVANCPCKYRFS
jgi:hypothetical protein